MKPIMRAYRIEEDYYHIRAFLREVFLYNDRNEISWHVARLDYWRWHLITNCHLCEPMEKAITLWEREEGRIVAVLNPVDTGEIRMKEKYEDNLCQ